MNKNIKFYIFTFSLFCFSCFAQNQKNNDYFYINPFIDSFLENLISKDVNLSKHYLTIISLKDNDGNYNIDFALTSGDLKTLKIISSKEVKVKYGNIEILLEGKTFEDFDFLKKSVKKTKKVFGNKTLSKDNHAFYDEDYVWSSFFNEKGELINLYIPEEKDSAFKIYENLKNKIEISPDFKTLDFNNFQKKLQEQIRTHFS